MNIWIDIDNSPHVPFFRPVIQTLRERGDEILITTRRYAQTLELLASAGLDYHVVGEHAGAGTARKVINLLGRSMKLIPLVRSFQPDVALSHGSRALSVTSKLMRIPNLLFFDYEWTEMQIFKRCASFLACPAVLPEASLRAAGIPLNKVLRYHGFKEEMYLPSFVPDENFRPGLNIGDDQILVTVRPSSMTSNYHDRRSEDILKALLLHFSKHPQVVMLVTPRTGTDKAFVQSIAAEHGIRNVRVSEKALPGMQLLFWSDLVVSGGGTMNRESALLGTPTVSMFTGKRPAIDEYLSSQSKLRFIESPADVLSLCATRNPRCSQYRYTSAPLVREIVEMIDRCADYSLPTVAQK